MDHITVAFEGVEGFVFDVGELHRELHRVTDLRCARGRRYRLPYLLTAIILAKLSGQHKPSAIVDWLSMHGELARALAHERTSRPSLNTIRRTLNESVDSEQLHTILRQFLHRVYGGHTTPQVVLDGKTMRGTISSGATRGVHLLAAYLPAEGITLHQLPVDSKSNEIAAAPDLLKQLDLKGRLVCGDAMFTQRDISVAVLAQGADYLWKVKGNQPTLAADIQRFFVQVESRPGWHIPPLPQRQATTTGKQHGRLERRTLTVIEDANGYLNWPGARQVFRYETCLTRQSDGRVTQQTLYGITSLSPEAASAEQLLAYVRACWGIEAGLHYRRDVTFREDHIRTKAVAQALCTATIHNFIVGLFNQVNMNNCATFQRYFAAAITKRLATYS